MSGQAGMKLAARVATEVMGWTERVWDGPDDTWWFDANGEACARVADFRPDLCAARAMEVVEEMHRRKLNYKLNGYFEGANAHWAAFDDELCADKRPLYRASAVTLPLAICYAALKAAGAWK